MIETVIQPEQDVPVIADVDVCVIGGGPGGLPAALASARQGASTLLVEMQGFFGGMATAGQIGPILGHTASRSHTPVIGGIPQEICQRMADMGHAWEWGRALQFWGIPFHSEGLKIVADRMVKEAGVDPLFHALFVDAIVTDEGLMTHAVIESKSGRQAIRARVFVDATGDADVAYRAGAECTKGRPADEMPMSMGSMFRFGGMASVPEPVQTAMVETMREAIRTGALNLYGAGLGCLGSTTREDERTANITRVPGDPTDVWDLTRAELATRELAWRVLDLWRSVPGAEGLYLVSTPAHVGLRESRQIVGEQRLTGEDVIEGRKRSDAIARCGYWIDIHCPRGLVDGGSVHLCSTACTKRDCYMLTDFADQLPTELYPPDDDWFDIPYGCLVPQYVDGLLVSGRCISADHQAMAATRVMGTCMAIGEAAGTAAALAAMGERQPRQVDVDELRETLIAAGALV
ncbi:MAG TPA: FAD-dependent oxidoreductase [Armatimonadota bacterium]|nr:FAD-dependent oxidoreductase [Armatimonadota bacterium]